MRARKGREKKGREGREVRKDKVLQPPKFWTLSTPLLPRCCATCAYSVRRSMCAVKLVKLNITAVQTKCPYLSLLTFIKIDMISAHPVILLNPLCGQDTIKQLKPQQKIWIQRIKISFVFICLVILHMAPHRADCCQCQLPLSRNSILNLTLEKTAFVVSST